MSFFEPPPPPEPPPEAFRQPPWMGPPDNVVGAGVPLRLVLARTEDVAVAIVGATAFPTGVLFDLAVRLREPREHPDFFHPFLLHARGGDVDELFRFGIQLADGSKATFEDHPPFDEQERSEPALVPRGGGGGGRSWDWDVWLWPLPPPGPLAFVVQWPAQQIPETRHEIDAAPIREAAERAELLWPDGEAQPGGSYSVRLYP
jgi:hypothetical protein